MKDRHIEILKEILVDYHTINTRYWDMYYKGIITRKECLVNRFKETAD